MEKSQVFGLKCDASLASFDRQSSSWKMSQLSLFEDYQECLGTLPSCGMMRNGVLYPLETLELHICESAGFVLPTPTAQDYKRRGPNSKQQGISNVENWIHKVPTPCAHEGRLGYQRRDPSKKGTQQSLTTIVIDKLGGRKKVSGQLNPKFVLWLMGFPKEWLN